MKYLVLKYGIEDKFFIYSRATSPVALNKDMHPEFQRILTEKGVEFEHRLSTLISEKEVDSCDYILYMDTNNFMNLSKLFPDKELKNAYRFSSFSNHQDDVEDPWFTGNYERCYKTIIECVRNFIKKLVTDGEI